MDRIPPHDFRRQATSALMHPISLAALGTLLANDLLLKALWPGAWIPGKLSDLAWMVFAPPMLAYILSFAMLESPQRQRAAFAAAYAGLPLLYAAFNTFPLVHNAILRALGLFGGDGLRSPLDPTDSLVIPFAMAAALWVWGRPCLGPESVRARLALLATAVAAVASVASTYDGDWGVGTVGRTASGALGALSTSRGSYESMDGGLTWTKTSEDSVPLQTQEWRELEVKTPSGDIYIDDGKYSQIIRERSEHELSESELRDMTVFWGPDDHLTAYGPSASREVVYSYEYLQGGGNRWMQALEKRNIEGRVIATWPPSLFYDDQSGNLIVAMGVQGVVVVAPDGTATRVTVGPYAPTDFSFRSKARTYFDALLRREAMVSNSLALLLTFSFAALALAFPTASVGPRSCLALAAATSVILALTMGVYPRELGHPADQDSHAVGYLAHMLFGYGLLPLLLAIGALAYARTSLRRVLAIAAVAIGMLPLIALGALALFETGTGPANLAAVGLVGAAALGLWAYQSVLT